MAALTGKAAKVKFTAASYSTAAAEAFTSLSPTTDKTEFRITDGAKRHWTRELPPVILVNSTAHTDFAWNPVQGKVTFGNPLTVAESAQVTGTVYWLTASYLPWTRSWTMDVDTNMHDTTCFSTSATDVQWRTFTAGLSGASVSLGRIVDTPTTETPVWFDHINTEQDVILELLINSAGSTHKWEAYARVQSDGFSDDTDALAEESVTMTIDGPLYMATTE
jgi:hypothetical protein